MDTSFFKKPEVWIGVVIFCVICALVAQSISHRNQIDAIQAEFESEMTRHNEDLAEMRAAYDRERQEQQAINERYRTEIERLNTDYNTRLAELETRVRTRRQRFIEETGGRPTEMADRLRDRLGWSGSEP